MNTTNKTTDTLRGIVSGVSALALSTEVAQVISQAPITLQKIDLEVDAKFNSATLQDRSCRIIIHLGELSPIALFQQRLK